MAAAGSRKDWRAQRSPIPIRPRDVRERWHGSLSRGGVVEGEGHSRHSCSAPLEHASGLGAIVAPQRLSSCEENLMRNTLEQRENLQHLGEENRLISTPRRRHDGHEDSEERKRLGFGETPFKQMPTISPLESGRRRAALENSLQSPIRQDCIAQLETGSHFDSRLPVKLLEHELGCGEGLTPKLDSAFRASEERCLRNRGNHESGYKPSSSSYAQRQSIVTQPVDSRRSFRSKESPKRSTMPCQIRRSSPTVRSRCRKARENSTSHAACGGA